MGNNPLETPITVVIPNYNGALYISAAIASVLAQEFTNLEIIVIDDGSTDDSLKVIREWGHSIRLIETKNQGASSARNAGIVSANSEFIAFLDSDDVWLPLKLKKQIEMMQNENLDLIYCHGQEFSRDSRGGIIHLAKYSGSCYEYFKKYPGQAIIDMGPSTVVVKKSVIESTGYFDTGFRGPAEDWDFFRRYCRNAKIGFYPEVLVLRRNHNNNVSNRSLREYYSGNRKAILKMFSEDVGIHFVERVKILAKLNFMIVKAFIRQCLNLSGIKKATD
jgi:glycosyltransferase involved in cell wall biosynthesis